MTVSTEFKDTKIGPIPVDWDEVKLNDVLIIGHGKDQKQVICEGGKYPILGTGGCIGYTNDFLYDKESVLIGRKGTIDKPQYMTTPFWTVDTLFYTKIKDNAIPKYIYYLFQSIDWYKHNEATGVPSLSSKNIINIQASLPPLPEQKKIAEVLSTVDDKIDSIEQEVDQIRTLKKGLMQKLLTGQLSVTGKPHTFKDSKLGPIPETREVVPLGYEIEIKHGFAFKGEFFGNTGPIILTPGNFNRNGGLYFTERNTKRYSGSIPEDYILSNEDLTVVMTDLSSLCEILGNPGLSIHGLLHNQRIGKVIFNTSRLNKMYLFFYLQTEYYKKEIKNTATGTTVRHSSPSKIRDVLIPIPSLPEQEKIAEILGEVDDKLEVLEDKKEQYTTLKKGLMQKLLTGKMRMTV